MTDSVEILTEHIAEDLRQGRFPPGTWLKQIELQQRYGAGRTAIRKALEILTVRRLVRHELNRGYSVYPHDDDQVRHVLELRVAIECAFADRMAATATPEEISHLQALADDFWTLAENGRMATLYAVNLEFHRALLGCARNPLIISQIEELRIRTSAAPVSQWPAIAQIKQSADEHFGMVAALRRRDAEGLRNLTRAHVLKDDHR